MSDLLYSGYLLKRGNFLKKWSKLFFELYPDKLLYYTTQNGHQKGEMEISFRTLWEDSTLRSFCFSLTSEKDGDSLILACETTNEKELWTDVISHLIVDLRKRAKKQNSGSHQQCTLSYHPKSQIFFKVIQACNLRDKNPDGFSNPYVTITLGSSVVQTTTRSKNLNPEWGMVFPMDFDRSMRYARLEIWNEDPNGKDDFLGVVMISLLSVGSGHHSLLWYPVGRRSIRSHVRGKIQIEIACQIAPVMKVDPFRIFRDIRLFPELQTCVISNISGCMLGNDRLTSEDSNALKELFSSASFPFQYPPVECETLEDITVKASLLASRTANRSLLVNGILLLTNFRLIFVSVMRLMTGVSQVASDSSDCSGGTKALPKLPPRRASVLGSSTQQGTLEIVTQIPLSNIISSALTSDTDGAAVAGLCPTRHYEVLTVKVSDGRKLSFIFLSDEDMLESSTPSDVNVVSGSKDDFTVSMSSHTGAAGSSTVNLSNKMFRRVADRAHPRRVADRTVTVDNDDLADDSPPPEHVPTRGGMLSVITPTLNMDNFMPSFTPSSSVQTASKNSKIYSAAEMDILHSIFGSTISINNFVDADQSDEGSPDQRFFNRLMFRTINRDGEKVALTGVNEKILTELNNSILAKEMIVEEAAALGSTSGEEETAPVQGDNSSSLVGAQRAFRNNLDMATLPLKIGLLSTVLGAWKSYDPLVEFARMGIPDAFWRVSHINAAYEVCPTYPQLIAVPNTTTDVSLIGASQFRSQGRLPALSWRNPETNCTICRCSQPLVGLASRRSLDDEALLGEINRSSGSVASLMDGASAARPYMIFDARPLLNAKANQAAGKGYENEKVYDNCCVLFMGIANIHVVRKSYDLLLEACTDELNWFRNLENSGWLGHIKSILMAVVRIVHCVSLEKLSVLVHCSDGWDRTAQLTSLSMLVLDGYYRTITGFITLIEKEWFSFGHKFGDRFAWTDIGWKDNERSPIFVQFLDCVFQCIHQDPNNFEFNEELLLFIMEQMGTGWFGNFFSNCEKDRKLAKETTVSMWLYVDGQRTKFTNPQYRPQSLKGIFIPVVSSQRIVLWEKWFLKWQDKIWCLSWMRSTEERGVIGGMNSAHARNAETDFFESDLSRFRDNSNVTWTKDSLVKNCHCCNCLFTVYRRKHHCRSCGNIFCEACTPERRVVVAISLTKFLRCCIDCIREIDMNRKMDDEADDAAVRSHDSAVHSTNAGPPVRTLVRRVTTGALRTNSGNDARLVPNRLMRSEATNMLPRHSEVTDAVDGPLPTSSILRSSSHVRAPALIESDYDSEEDRPSNMDCSDIDVGMPDMDVDSSDECLLPSRASMVRQWVDKTVVKL